MKGFRIIAAALVAVQFACTRAESQGAGTTLTLDGKLPVSFAQISNVVALDGDRIAFADTRAMLFLTADLRSGEIDTIGTRVDSIALNSQAGEYKFPGWVVHLAGDTVALVDFAAQRTTLWDERGRPLSVLTLPPVAGPAPVLMYDAVGHGYKIDYQAILGGGVPGTPVRPDSIAVFRIDLATKAVDTVAQLAAPEYGDARFGEQVQQVAKIFAPNDLVGALPDGTVWVARGRENRIDWRAPDGRWTQGEPHEFEKVAVTQDDRDRFMERMHERGLQRGIEIAFPFAEHKAPFEMALGRPNGEVWLQRPRASEDRPMVYDVIDRNGKRSRTVEFPAGATLIGFGRDDAIFAALREGEGRTVARYRLR